MESIIENTIISEYEKNLNEQHYSVKLLLSTSKELIIKVFNTNSTQEICHKKTYNISDLKHLTKSFEIYDSLEGIFNCIKNILEKGKVSILIKEEFLVLSFQVFLPDGNTNTINFELNKGKMNKDEMIKMLSERIILLEKKIEAFQKNENKINNDLMKRLQILEEKEKKRDEKEKKEKEEMKYKDIKESSIVKENEIAFFEQQLKTYEKFKNKNIKFKLLYKASRDSDKINIFHIKCDYKESILLIIRSQNGSRFGGYTQIGFNDSGNEMKDENAFVYSLDKLAVYRVKKGEISIYCQKDLYGFKNTIYIYDNCLTKKDNRNIGGCSNYPCQKYELNNNEEYFICSEIEAYQIIGE